MGNTLIIVSTQDAKAAVQAAGHEAMTCSDIMQDWLQDADQAFFLPPGLDGRELVIIPNTDDRDHAAISDWLKLSMDRAQIKARMAAIPGGHTTIEAWSPDKAALDDVLDGCRFKIISFADMLAMDMRMDWVVRDYVGKGGTCQIFGSSGSGKSFFALDMSYCVAAGIDFFGKKTKRGNVLYIAGEGFQGLKKRAVALQKKYGAIIHDSLDFSRQAAQLLSLDSCLDVAERIRAKPGGYDLVVIDTLNRNFGAGDENSTQDMTAFVQNVDLHIRAPGCAVVIVHHTGLQNKERARGSGALYNAIDSEFRVEKDEAQIMTISCTKNKEGASGWSELLHLRTVVVGYDDEEKEEVTSCYIDRPMVAGHEVMPKRQQIVLEALKVALEDVGIDTAEGRCVTVEEWRRVAKEGLGTGSGYRDFAKYSKKLIEDGVVFMVENEVFLNP
jgi:hypothetical protein